MKLSVLIPVYNVEEYLEECVDSVLQQSNQDFEIILVDDGSTDSSGVICDRLREAHSDKIEVIHKKNEGQLLARQDAVHAAGGEILLFLDSDDCLRADALETIADCFNQTDCDMVLYNASDRRDFSNKFRSYPFEDRFTMKGEKKTLLYRLVAESRIPNSVCLKASRKECFSDLPAFRDYSYVKNGEDLLLSLYLITAAEKIVYVDETLYFYRQREGSIVHSYNPDRARSIKTVHQEMERFIDCWDMPELHPVHDTREVRGWVETLLILLNNRKQMKPDELHRQLQALAEDSYFIRAYEAMDGKNLSREHRLMAKWL